MVALLIIALLIGIVALAVGIVLIVNYPCLKSENEKLNNAIGYMKADIDAQRKNILDLSAQVAKLAKEKGGDGLIKKITYDAENDTVKIDGNLSVSGWVSSGEMKKEE